MKVLVEIDIPEMHEHILKDKGKNIISKGLDFINFIEKTLTKKWFGCGVYHTRYITPPKNTKYTISSTLPKDIKLYSSI